MKLNLRFTEVRFTDIFKTMFQTKNYAKQTEIICEIEYLAKFCSCHFIRQAPVGDAHKVWLAARMTRTKNRIHIFEIDISKHGFCEIKFFLSICRNSFTSISELAPRYLTKIFLYISRKTSFLANRKYECPICLLCMRDPHQTSCGHRSYFIHPTVPLTCEILFVQQFF